MSPKPIVAIVVLILLCACHNGIQTDNTLSTTDKNYIHNLGLLDSDEEIIKFNSQLNNKVSGNFFTNKRVASYWMDERDKSKNRIASAFYSDIKSIDTNYMRTSLTYAPYLEVTRNDSTKFKVYVDGKKVEIQSFFEEAVQRWNEEKLKGSYYR
jgi:hypothetical protein